MLGKILKYDIKATARFFIPMYIGLAVMTFFNKLFIELVRFDGSNQLFDTLRNTFLIMYILFVIAAFIGNYVILIYYFYKNMTGDQAYLTFTLPVTTGQLINGKILVSALWTFLTYLFMMISFLIYPAGHGLMKGIGEFFEEIQWVWRHADHIGQLNYFLIILLLIMIVNLFTSLMVFYASIAIGHLFGKYRVIGSIVSYIAIYIVNQIIVIILMFSTRIVNYNMSGREVFPVINRFMTFTLIYSLIIAALYYFVTHYVFSKKLNLE